MSEGVKRENSRFVSVEMGNFGNFYVRDPSLTCSRFGTCEELFRKLGKVICFVIFLLVNRTFVIGLSSFWYIDMFLALLGLIFSALLHITERENTRIDGFQYYKWDYFASKFLVASFVITLMSLTTKFLWPGMISHAFEPYNGGFYGPFLNDTSV